MAKKLVLASHAGLAKGFLQSLKFIFHPEDKIHVISAFTEMTDPGKAFDHILDTFGKDDLVIVMTDLSGGSVNKMIAEPFF